MNLFLSITVFAINYTVLFTVKMKITFDDLYLVTVSDDSTIMMWKIQDREGRTIKREKDVGWAEEILITKSDLEEKVSEDNSKLEENLTSPITFLKLI